MKAHSNRTDPKDKSPRYGTIAAALIGQVIHVDGVGDITVKNQQHLSELLRTQTK